jgi:hypothetical protein
MHLARWRPHDISCLSSSVLSSPNNSIALPLSTSHICSDFGCECLCEVAPASIVTLVMVTPASGALFGQTIYSDVIAALQRTVKSEGERRCMLVLVTFTEQGF